MVKTAHVGISRISELHITPLPMERRYDSTGDLSVHPEVAARYIAAGYNQAPKSKEERNARGLTGGWNGMNTSLVNIRQYATNDGSLFVSADIAPARYLLGKAAEDVVDVGKL